MRKWYAVHTHVRGELLASVNLLRQGFTVYLPQCIAKRRHARRTEIVKNPLFPRYLFVAHGIPIHVLEIRLLHHLLH